MMNLKATATTGEVATLRCDGRGLEIEIPGDRDRAPEHALIFTALARLLARWDEEFMEVVNSEILSMAKEIEAGEIEP